MDELLSRVVLRLCRVREELGQEAFEEASLQALLAIARVVHRRAEERAGSRRSETGSVIPLPSRDR